LKVVGERVSADAKTRMKLQSSEMKASPPMKHTSIIIIALLLTPPVGLQSAHAAILSLTFDRAIAQPGRFAVEEIRREASALNSRRNPSSVRVWVTGASAVARMRSSTTRTSRSIWLVLGGRRASQQETERRVSGVEKGL